MVLVRRADERDVPELVRLRAVMLDAMGRPVGAAEGSGAWFTERLWHPDRFAAFVSEDVEIGVAACAVGLVDDHVPSPSNPHGQLGRILNVATDPRARRRGHARAVMSALLDWFDRHTDVADVRLMATPDGAALYHQLGFAAPTFPLLARPSRPRSPTS